MRSLSICRGFLLAATLAISYVFVVPRIAYERTTIFFDRIIAFVGRSLRDFATTAFSPRLQFAGAGPHSIDSNYDHPTLAYLRHEAGVSRMSAARKT